MGLNKQKGNMFSFADFTWNPIKGRCKHNCVYCFMHRYWKMMKNDKLRLDEKEFKELDRDMIKYGDSGHFIFVGSSTDMWLGKTEWISKILVHIAKYSKNTYLFQTKFPFGFYDWTFYDNQILGITLETNRRHAMISTATEPVQRVKDFMEIEHARKMVTIEPIMDFDIIYFIRTIKDINPEWVNIGADSGGNNLPEPPKEKVLQLINELEKFTVVKQKQNLKRLLNG